MDLSERVPQLLTQKYITADNVIVDVELAINYRVKEDMAERAVLEVKDFDSATVLSAFVILRTLIEAIMLEEVLAEREKIRDQLQVRMDEVTDRWGVEVSKVEINKIDPPPRVKQAMLEMERSAEAIKTAEITESERTGQAQINRAKDGNWRIRRTDRNNRLRRQPWRLR